MVIPWYEYRELFIVVPSYVIALVLAFWYIPFLNSQESSEEQYYALAIGDDSTTYKIGDGELTLTLDNNLGQRPASLYIYGLTIPNNAGEGHIFVSTLYSHDGRPVGIGNIMLRPNTISPSSISTTPMKVDVSIENSRELGEFRGWFMLLLGQELISLPLKASTDPLFQIAVLWVSVGALITIGTWELGRFFDRRHTEERLSEFTNNTTLATNNQAEFLALQDKKIKYNLRLRNSRQVIKFAFVDTFSFIFGIGLFYIGLLDNSFVTGLQTISEFDIYSLIGIGVGIGSLGGFLNKQ